MHIVETDLNQYLQLLIANKHQREFVLFDCDCYKQYKDFLFDGKFSYFACIKYKDIIYHTIFPIILNTELDYYIRTKYFTNAIFESWMAGKVFISGRLMVVISYVTNNLRSGHVYYYKKSNLYEYRLLKNLSDNKELKLFYTKKDKVKWFILNAETERIKKMKDRKNRKRKAGELNEINPKSTVECSNTEKNVNTDLKLKQSNDWINYLSDDPNDKDIYEEFFENCIDNPIELDSLENKIIILSPEVLKRFLFRLLVKYENVSGSLESKCKIIRTTMETGIGSTALPKQTSTRMKESGDQGSIYSIPESHKLGFSLASNSKRTLNDQQSINSDVRKRKDDFKYFIDPINTKELKSAGCTLVLSECTTSSPCYNDSVIEEKILNNLSNSGNVYIFLEGFYTKKKIYSDSPKNTILYIKTFLPDIATRTTDKFCNLMTRGGMNIKWSIKYNCFLSTHEVFNYFPDAFTEYDPRIQYNSGLLRYCSEYMYSMKAPKLVVVINNIKGAALIINSQNHLRFAFNNPNYNTFLKHNVALSPPSYIATTKLSENSQHELSIPIYNNYEIPQKMYLNLTGWNGSLDRRKEYYGFSYNELNITDDVINRISMVLDPTSTNIYKFDCNNYHMHPILLFTEFGDFGGYTNEDAIVIDKTFVENGPLKIISVTLDVRFVPANGSSLKNAFIEYVSNNIDGSEWASLIFGVLKSNIKLETKNKSKSVEIKETVIGENSFNYTISFKEFSPFSKIIDSIWLSESKTVRIHYRIEKKISKGDKLTNLHGQKGVISHIADLSKYKREFNGQTVYPQVKISINSLLGRMTVSMVLEILHASGYFVKRNQVETALTGCAPLAWYIHNIDSTIRGRISKPKLDLMTGENGFAVNLLQHTLHESRLNNNNPLGPEQSYSFMKEIMTTYGTYIKEL